MANNEQDNRYVIVNATALDQSGAITILKQFLEAILDFPNNNYYFIVFVHPDLEYNPSKSNLLIVKKDVKSLIKRFFWDLSGLKQWLNKNKITPSITFSLQNTNFRTKYVPNFVYYHQSIPFFNANWNPLRKDERALWFYSTIYPFFVKLFLNKQTEIFVQTNFIKESFASFYSFPKERIHIIFPKLQLYQNIKVTTISFLNKKKINLFYPATPFIYKNHIVIFKALRMLPEKNQKQITLHLTCTESEISRLVGNERSIFEINYAGRISFEDVIGTYQNADALLFPSYIETIGLPLIEAAAFGMPIIVSDLPYAREVLNDYGGVAFVKYNDSNLWMKEIGKILDNKGRRYDPIKLDKKDSWQTLFEIMKNKTL